MVRFESFSPEVCQQLLDKGFSHFVIRQNANEGGENESAENNEVITLVAQRGRVPERAIPIRRFMTMARRSGKYYIMHTDSVQ